jgi:4'-phosphopantetheinyl transferase
MPVAAMARTGDRTLIELAYLDITSSAAEPLAARYAREEDHRLAGRHRHPQARRQRLMVRVLLRAILTRCYPVPAGPWRILRDSDGAPRLAADDPTAPLPSISLSHSGSMVACAISSFTRLGIDIELIRPDRQVTALASAAFGPTERGMVAAGGVDAFYRIWTLREALAKASGAGFGLLIDRTDMVPPDPDAPGARRNVGGTEWDFAYWRLPEPYGLGLVWQRGAAGIQAPVPNRLAASSLA